jgi:hypothetical protein
MPIPFAQAVARIGFRLLRRNRQANPRIFNARTIHLINQPRKSAP